MRHELNHFYIIAELLGEYDLPFIKNSENIPLKMK